MAEQYRCCPLARLPWIPMTTCSDEDSINYFTGPMLMTQVLNGSMGHRAFEIYRYMNFMFPFYLPGRYHSMDCEALLKGSSKEQYFSNAFFFLLSTHLHGPRAWKTLHYPLKYLPTLISGIEPMICPKLKKQIFQDSRPEQCGSAAEFLLEPWVIVQLPYQPVILHQWLVAALAEMYMLRTETADFKYLPVPLAQNQEIKSAIQAVQLIHANLLALELCIFNGFSSLEAVFEADLNTETWLSFYTKILTMLPFLEYVVSKEARRVVRAAKRFLWNGSPAISGIILLKVPPYFNRAYRFYLDEFWSQDGEMHCIFPRWPSDDPVKDFNASNACPHDCEPCLASCSNVMKIKQIPSSNIGNDLESFIDETIILPGWIEGINREKVMQLLENDPLIFCMFSDYKDCEGKCRAYAGILESEFGILDSVIVMSANYQKANNLAAMKARLLYLAEMKDGAQFNFTAGSDCAGPDVSPLDMSSSILNKISPETTKAILKELTDYCEVDFDGEWFFIPEELDKNKQPTFIRPEDFLSKLRDSFDKNCSSDEWETICKEPDMDSLEIREIAFNLEMRIKNLLFGIAEKIFASRRDDGEVSHSYEAAFIQYILPCFVAFFLKHASDSQLAMNDKKCYLSFVHRLIKTYENSSRDNSQNYNSGVTAYTAVSWNALNTPLALNLIDRHQSFFRSVIKAMFPFKKEVLAVQLTRLNCCENSGFFQVIADFLLMLQQNNSASEAAVANGVRIDWACPVAHTARYMARMKHALLGSTHDPMHSRLAQSYTALKVLKVLVSSCHTVNSGILIVHKIITARINDLGGHTYVDDREVKVVVKSDVEQHAKKLSLQQLMGILFYHYINLDNKMLINNGNEKCNYEAFYLDHVELALFSFVKKHLWRMKQIVATWLNDNGGVDLSLATYELAKSAPTLYGQMISNLNRSGKIKMDHPGEFTFFPIKHCRWCGRVWVRDFKVCKLCIENPEYPDRNLFCSEQCEDKAIAKVHREEHAQFLLVKLEIVN